MLSKLRKYRYLVLLVFLTACASNALAQADVTANPTPLGLPDTLTQPLEVDDVYDDWYDLGTYSSPASLDPVSYGYTSETSYVNIDFVGLYEKPDGIMHMVSLYVYTDTDQVHVCHNTEEGFWYPIPADGKALQVGLLDGEQYMIRFQDGKWQARVHDE